MKASELRIGNLVDFDDGNGDVGKINAHQIYLLSIDSDCGIKPAVLMEEWFLKFGFVYNDKTNTWVKGIPNIHGDNIFFFSIIIIEGDLYFSHSGLCAMPIQYIHHLQNLYFALTGEELRIKE
jgi:hypothetical protein